MLETSRMCANLDFDIWTSSVKPIHLSDQWEVWRKCNKLSPLRCMESLIIMDQALKEDSKL